jgi:hypothetical protein
MRWQDSSFSTAADHTFPEAATAVEWCGSKLAVATANALFLVEAMTSSSGRATPAARWPARGAATLCALSDELLCIVQGTTVSYFRASTAASHAEGSAEAYWDLQEPGTAATHLSPLLFVSCTNGVSVHVAAPEASHGTLQLLRRGNGADGEAGHDDAASQLDDTASLYSQASVALSTQDSGTFTRNRRGHARGRAGRGGGEHVATWLVATGATEDSVAWVAPRSSQVHIGSIASVQQQVAVATRYGMLREALSLTDSEQDWPGRDAAAAQLRVALGVQLCDEVCPTLHLLSLSLLTQACVTTILGVTRSCARSTHSSKRVCRC